MNWLPMETAPKDGTLILVSVKQGSTSAGGGRNGTRWWNKTVPAAWQRDAWYAYSPSWWGEIRYQDWIGGWMPLPEPPKPEVEYEDHRVA
jgi:hypothetical protein